MNNSTPPLRVRRSLMSRAHKIATEKHGAHDAGRVYSPTQVEYRRLLAEWQSRTCDTTAKATKES